jgi:hypothetical protein
VSLEEFMNDDIALLKANLAQISEIKAKLSEKIKIATNTAFGSDVIDYVSIDTSKKDIEFQLFGKLR